MKTQLNTLKNIHLKNIIWCIYINIIILFYMKKNGFAEVSKNF